jgi:NmrA-like family
MQTILVVGATGTVGAPVAQRLLEDGFAVRLLVRESTGHAPSSAASTATSTHPTCPGSWPGRTTPPSTWSPGSSWRRTVALMRMLERVGKVVVLGATGKPGGSSQPRTCPALREVT